MNELFDQPNNKGSKSNNFRQVDWIKTASEAQRPFRAGVVGWQNSVYVVCQLIENHKAVTQENPSKIDPHHPMKCLVSRRLVIASLQELATKVHVWCATLHKSKIDCSTLDAVCAVHNATLERAKRQWEPIRQLAFHFNDLSLPSDDLIKVYGAVDLVSDNEIDNVWNAIWSIGNKARDISLNYV